MDTKNFERVYQAQTKIEQWYKETRYKRLIRNIPFICIYFFIIITAAQYPIKVSLDIILLYVLMVYLAILLFVIPWRKYI